VLESYKRDTPSKTFALVLGADELAVLGREIVGSSDSREDGQASETEPCAEEEVEEEELSSSFVSDDSVGSHRVRVWVWWKMSDDDREDAIVESEDAESSTEQSSL
jgi:hypothetical protein